jgi:hypothetical protein
MNHEFDFLIDEVPYDRYFDPLLDLLNEEDEHHNRIGCGVTACPYCGEVECNFSCDESQADGFNNEDKKNE